MDEFALIRRYFADLNPHAEGVVLGIGDDGAILAPPAGHELLMTTDTLVAGRHFPLDTAAADIGWKALAVNLSDLAAMGARPLWFLLALTLPEPDESWLRGFASGLRELANDHGIALVGGDTTRGPLSITITAVGAVPTGTALRRDGAKPGDLVCVTGTLGDAALALEPALARGVFFSVAAAESRTLCAQSEQDNALLRARLDRPTPRIAAGLALREVASAAIDLSDGLAGDLLHVLAASGVGADLHAHELPMSEAFARQSSANQRLAFQAAGGDDYELCVCIPHRHLFAARTALQALPLTIIGQISSEKGLRWCNEHGELIRPELLGYQHFHD